MGKALAVGAAVFLLTGIIGAGGGFVVVLTLALLAGLTMLVAAGHRYGRSQFTRLPARLSSP